LGVVPWMSSILAFALLVASSRSGTMALIAAWKASSRESCAGFFSVFWFGVEDFGRGRPDGPLFSAMGSSLQSSSIGLRYVEHRVRDVSIKGDQQIAFGISLECLVTVCSYSRSKQIGCIYGAAHDGWMNNAITIRGPIDNLLLPCSDMMSMRSIPSDQCISA
ncbi:hypothetical protein KCU92_g49, partial [Aureobasidium melanogenum]